jgi:hypothetical protein
LPEGRKRGEEEKRKEKEGGSEGGKESVMGLKPVSVFVLSRIGRRGLLPGCELKLAVKRKHDKQMLYIITTVDMQRTVIFCMQPWSFSGLITIIS